jgi:hypothetical protein
MNKTMTKKVMFSILAKKAEKISKILSDRKYIVFHPELYQITNNDFKIEFYDEDNVIILIHNDKSELLFGYNVIDLSDYNYAINLLDSFKVIEVSQLKNIAAI